MTYLRWAIWKVSPDWQPEVPDTRHFCCGGTWPSLWCFSRAWRARCAPWAQIGTLIVQLHWGWGVNWESSLGWCCWYSRRTVVKKPTRWRRLYNWWTWGTCGTEPVFIKWYFYFQNIYNISPINFKKGEEE